MEETIRRGMPPVLVFVGKLDVCEMAGDACHGNVAVSPVAPKVKAERVVLYVRNSRVMLVGDVRNEYPGSDASSSLTVCLVPPERWSATALEMEGFSATQRIFIFRSTSFWCHRSRKKIPYWMVGGLTRTAPPRFTGSVAGCLQNCNMQPPQRTARKAPRGEPTATNEHGSQKS
jgi:hypothetical protein